MAYFEIRNLTFSYNTASQATQSGMVCEPVPALDDVCMSIEQGEYVLVCGKSGSGKTTLLKSFKPVLMPAGVKKGNIFAGGILIEDLDKGTQAGMVGFVMQDPDAQIVTDKVWHELAFGLENLGTDPKVMRARVAEMASYFGIQDWFDRDTFRLSGGQKQLLNLASVMVMQPRLLVLDEPTSQLDPIAAADFLNTIRKINQELGTTIIISEHRLEDIYPSADRVAVLDKGKLIAWDSPGNTAEILYEKENAMAEALPSPIRIFYGMDSMGKPEAEHSANAALKSEECPLTVKDGRKWLEHVVKGRKICSEVTEGKLVGAKDKADIAVSIKNLWFRYDKTGADVLKGVNLDVPKGQLTALVGGNGTGKSTLLKCICRACRPYRGKVTVKGLDASKISRSGYLKNNVAMLPQDPKSIFAKTSVRAELEEMLGSIEAGRLERREETEGADNVPLDDRIKSICEICGIQELLNRHPYDLSGGEIQRAALGKVLMTQPEILLLDEPTKGIDGFFKKKLGRILEELKARGVTILMVSHDVEFCAEYADSVGMFFNGEVITVNKTEQFFSSNSFYTTAANRMARQIWPEAVTSGEVIEMLHRSMC